MIIQKEGRALDEYAIDVSRFEMAIALDALAAHAAHDLMPFVLGEDCESFPVAPLIKKLREYDTYYPWLERGEGDLEDRVAHLVEKIEYPVFVTCHFSGDEFEQLLTAVRQYLCSGPLGGVERDFLGRLLLAEPLVILI